MKPIKKILKDHVNPVYFSEKLYGVEIEVEGEKLPTLIPGGLWRVETDSSLKTEEAYEYVTTGPDTLEGVKSRLTVLNDVYKINKSIIHDSVRAGVHVHMNVQDWDVKQLITFATCYYIVEDVLLKWCGENREGNLFCLRTRDAEFVLFKLIETLNNRNMKYLNNDIIRYASLNYYSLFKYGTVEFRGMRGTSDLDTIYEWVEIINELRESSLNFSSPIDVIDQMSGDGEFNFFKTLFPTKHQHLKCPDIEKIIRNSTRRIQMLAFGVDWSNIDKQSVNIFKDGGVGF